MPIKNKNNCTFIEKLLAIQKAYPIFVVLLRGKKNPRCLTLKFSPHGLARIKRADATNFPKHWDNW